VVALAALELDLEGGEEGDLFREVFFDRRDVDREVAGGLNEGVGPVVRVDLVELWVRREEDGEGERGCG